MLFPNGADDRALLLPNPQGVEAEDGRTGTDEAGAMLGRQPYMTKADTKMKVKVIAVNLSVFFLHCLQHSNISTYSHTLYHHIDKPLHYFMTISPAIVYM